MTSFGAVVSVDAYKTTPPSCTVRLNDTPHSEIVNFHRTCSPHSSSPLLVVFLGTVAATIRTDLGNNVIIFALHAKNSNKMGSYLCCKSVPLEHSEYTTTVRSQQN